MPPTNGNDVLVGTTAAESISALGGNDSVDAKTRPSGGPGIDEVDGGLGIDTLIVDCSAETLSVQLGSGGSPTYTVRSTSGNFYVDAYNMERVQFTGGSGADTIDTGERGGTVNGGGGIDHWFANISGVFADVVFALGTTTAIASAGLTSILGIERLNLTTGAGDDTIVGGAQGDTINTGEGDDTIDAKTRPSSGAADLVDGGSGTDTLVVNASAETQSVQFGIAGSPNVTVRSNSGNFYVDGYSIEIVKLAGGAGADTIDTGALGGTIDGNGGVDHWFADLSAVTTDIAFTLGTTTAIAAAGLTSIREIERLTLTTGGGDDVIVGGAQGDTINTGAGDDTIDAKARPSSGAADLVDGGSGTDTLIVNAAAETLGVQFVVAGSPNFTVRSTSNNFYVDGYSIEIVKLAGGAGADTINTGSLAGTIDGNGGVDHWTANLSALTTGVAFTLGTTTAIAAAGLTSILDIERLSLTTGSGADAIVGGAQADTIATGAGDDTINAKTRPVGGGPIDIVDGGTGTDTLVVDASAETQGVQMSVGGSPNFTVRSLSDNFYLDAYNIDIVKVAGGAAADTINTGAFGGTVDGNGGVDYWTANLGALTTGVAFTLGTTTSIAAAGLTSILDIERLSLVTGSGADSIVGGAQADTISTGAGNDRIDAKTRPAGGADLDIVDGGSGTDTLVVVASAETQGVQIGAGFSPSFTVRSTSGNFYVDAYRTEILKVATGSGADTVTGGSLADAITTNAGNDTANGGDGADVINTGAGADKITGGRGADAITLGADADDVFYFSVLDSAVFNGTVDTISDFASGADDIDLSAIDANNLGADGNQAFTLINGAAFTGVAGQLRSVAGLIEADVNGDGAADFRILLSNNAVAVAGDLIL